MNILLDSVLMLGLSTLVIALFSLVGLGQLSNNQTSGIQALIDNIPPVIAVPNNATLEASNPNGKTITYNVVAADQVDGTVNVTCDTLSGSIFPIGNTKVDCEATDKSRNKVSASFQITIQDSTPPDTMIVGSRAGWVGIINSSSATMSDQVNFEIAGSDLIGVQDYECKLDSGKWIPIQHPDSGRDVCQYSKLPAGLHIFEARAIDKYGNVDKSPTSFNWSVTSIEDGIQEMMNLVSANLTVAEKQDFDLPLIQSQELFPNIRNDDKLSVCYNMDSFLNEINNLSLNDKLNKSQENQLIISALSLKDRLACE
jgi:hypothetical protein